MRSGNVYRLTESRPKACRIKSTHVVAEKLVCFDLVTITANFFLPFPPPSLQSPPHHGSPWLPGASASCLELFPGMCIVVSLCVVCVLTLYFHLTLLGRLWPSTLSQASTVFRERSRWVTSEQGYRMMMM